MKDLLIIKYNTIASLFNNNKSVYQEVLQLFH